MTAVLCVSAIIVALSALATAWFVFHACQRLGKSVFPVGLPIIHGIPTHWCRECEKGFKFVSPADCPIHGIMSEFCQACAKENGMESEGWTPPNIEACLREQGWRP